MTYSDKVKASNIIINAINGLKDSEHIIVTYGTNYDNEPQRYKINCNIFRGGKPSYSIYKDEVFGLSGMNIESINKTTAKAYTYDMMNQRSTYTFPLYEMELVDQPFLVKENEMEFVG